MPSHDVLTRVSFEELACGYKHVLFRNPEFGFYSSDYPHQAVRYLGSFLFS